MQARVIAAARARGLDPARLSPSQYRALSIEVRSATETVRDAVKVTTAAARVAAGKTVSLEQAERNAATCRSNACGKYRRFPNGTEACDACNCQGKLLQFKLLDEQGECPLGHWTNQAANGGGDAP